MPALATITIDVLSDRSGVDGATIRSYERQGLIPKPRKLAGIPTLYRLDDIDTVRFVRRALGLGFPPQAVRELTSLAGRPGATCIEVYDLARRHLDDIERRIAELEQLKQALEPVVESCPRQASIDGCTILGALRAPD